MACGAEPSASLKLQRQEGAPLCMPCRFVWVSSCFYKRRHPNKGGADAHAASHRASTGGDATVYHCRICDGWHVTTDTITSKGAWLAAKVDLVAAAVHTAGVPAHMSMRPGFAGYEGGHVTDPDPGGAPIRGTGQMVTLLQELLTRQGTPVGQGELAERTGISHATVHWLVAKLAAAGWVHCQVGARRAKLVMLRPYSVAAARRVVDEETVEATQPARPEPAGSGVDDGRTESGV